MPLNGKSDPMVWDSLVPYFIQKTKGGESYTPGIDNFEAVYPILDCILSEYLKQKEISKCRVCDFGCGTGILAERLSQHRFQTFACDYSRKMIDLACLATEGNVKYGVGSMDFIQEQSPLDVVTSIMVFQFISDFGETARIISECLRKSGILFFAVHNPSYVYEWAESGSRFRGISNSPMQCAAQKGEIQIEKRWIETYIRSPQWYYSILSTYGLDLVGETYKEDMSKSATTYQKNTVSYPKYYVAWYKKMR